MIITRLISALLVICTFACRGQLNHNNVNNQKQTSMEKFDIAEFNKKSNNGEYQFTLKDGSQVRQIENAASQDYTVEMKNPPDPHSVLKLFYFKSGNLKAQGEKFYSFPIGKWMFYDESGLLIKETNWDSAYKFTIEDLDKKMRDMGINIMQMKPGVDVHRASVGNPLYIVSYPIDPTNIYDVYELKIDGISGKTVEKTIQQTRN